ncbi:hypothetical protein [Nocardia sp. NPDC058705]|uniref:hypothetical protein n=1 Tax=Nocardia sp. NPDC058705 TaxID=3346609 RepID=UPI00369EB7B1
MSSADREMRTAVRELFGEPTDAQPEPAPRHNVASREGLTVSPPVPSGDAANRAAARALFNPDSADWHVYNSL